MVGTWYLLAIFPIAFGHSGFHICVRRNARLGIALMNSNPFHTRTGWVQHCPAQLPRLQQEQGQKRPGLLAAATPIILLSCLSSFTWRCFCTWDGAPCRDTWARSGELLQHWRQTNSMNMASCAGWAGEESCPCVCAALPVLRNLWFVVIFLLYHECVNS